jgi:small subunit ribosomal protein S5
MELEKKVYHSNKAPFILSPNFLTSHYMSSDIDNIEGTTPDSEVSSTPAEGQGRSRRGRGKRSSRDSQDSRDQDSNNDLNEKTVKITRVSKVVKGGRRFSFSALVVAGDGSGRVGYGLGKSAEVPDAIRKATDSARKSLLTIPVMNGTIPHEIVGKFGPTQVVLKPAAPGTGVIAGSAVRAIVEAVGITDIRTKCIGSNNSHNVLHATMKGLTSLRNPSEVAELKNADLTEIEYAPF